MKECLNSRFPSLAWTALFQGLQHYEDAAVHSKHGQATEGLLPDGVRNNLGPLVPVEMSTVPSLQGSRWPPVW